MNLTDIVSKKGFVDIYKRKGPRIVLGRMVLRLDGLDSDELAYASNALTSMDVYYNSGADHIRIRSNPSIERVLAECTSLSKVMECTLNHVRWRQENPKAPKSVLASKQLDLEMVLKDAKRSAA